MIITVALEALTGNFNTDIDRSAKRAERDIKRMERELKRSLNNVGSFFRQGLALVGVAASIAAVTSALKNLVSEADKLRDFSKQVGISVETLSQYGEVAERFGVSSEQINQALAKLNSNIAGAAAGNKKAQEGFRLLGLEAESSPGKIKPLEQVFREIADVISKLPPGSALAQRALEKLTGVAELAPLFQEGGEAIEKYRERIEALGGTITTDFANKSDELGDAASDMGTAFSGLGREIARDLLPPLTEAAKFITDLLAQRRFLEKTPRGIQLQIQEKERELSNLPGGPGAYGHERLLRELADLRTNYAAATAEVEKNNAALTKQDPAKAAAAKQLEEELLRKENELKGKGERDAAARKAEQEAKRAAADARRLQEAIAQGESDIFLAGLDRQRQALEADLDLRQISYKDYLAEKLRLTEDEINAEIAAAEGLLQGAERDEAAILQARIQTLEIQREIARESKTQEEAKYARELADAYEDAARSAQSYVDEISRAGQRELLLLDLTPKERRFAQGQFQIDDRFRSDKEQLDSLGLEQEEYDKRLEALQGFYAQATDEHRKYFEAIEAKQKDFTTGFNNAINEYIDATQNAGAVLGDTLVEALDEATHAASRAAAEFILFRESPREAIYQLARSISTQLLQALIQVGIQALLTKTLLAGIGGGQVISPADYLLPGGRGFQHGGYTGDDPRDKVTGVTHGQEFVVNAEATRQNRGLLEAINSGTFSGDTPSVPSSSGQGFNPTLKARIINVPDKSYIKDYLMGDDGDEVFINWVGRNGVRLKSAVANA